MTSQSPSSADSHLPEGSDDPGSTLMQCILCRRKDNKQMIRYHSLTSQVRDFITTHFGETILNEQRICKKHVLEIKRKCNDDGYVPDWQKVKANEIPPQPAEPTGQCGNPICTNSEYQKLITPSFAPINDP